MTSKVHGHTAGGQSPTYKSWHDMKDRCLNPNNDFYSHYGGRGIVVCEQWLRFESFLANMGERPKGTTIDRINVNGNYEPSNCRWATGKQQADNTTRTVYLTVDGITKSITEWSKQTGLNRNLIRSRIERSWKPQDVLRIPVGATSRYIRKPKRETRQPLKLTIDGDLRTVDQWSRVS